MNLSSLWLRFIQRVVETFVGLKCTLKVHEGVSSGVKTGWMYGR